MTDHHRAAGIGADNKNAAEIHPRRRRAMSWTEDRSIIVHREQTPEEGNLFAGGSVFARDLGRIGVHRGGIDGLE
jgi:hypothetical protein